MTDKITNQSGQNVEGNQINVAGDANIEQIGDNIDAGGGDFVAGNKTISVSYIGMGTVIIFALIIIGMFFVQTSLTSPVDDISSPTPLAFAAADKDETLLVIVDFDDRSKGQIEGVDPAQRIFNLITEKLPASNLSLRVEQYHQPAQDSAKAREILETYGATILIWGWYDSFGAQPSIELDKEKVSLNTTTLSEVNIATPESILMRFVKDIPAQASYLSLFSLGMMQMNAGETDSATNFFTQAIETAKTAASSNITQPWEALMWRGNIYSWSDEPDLAIDDYTEALKLHPHREAFFNRGFSYGAKSDHDRAIADYNRAIEIDPNYTAAYVNRGNKYGDKRDLDRAIVDYNKAIEIDPNYIAAYVNRGNKYGDKGDLDRAFADYNKAIEIDPEDIEAYLNRGSTYNAKGDYNNAFSDVASIIMLDPTYADAYTVRGNIYSELNQFNEAIADYQYSIELGPNPYTYCVLGITFTKIGDFPSAIGNLEQGVSMDTNSQYPWCDTALEKAYKRIPTS